MIYAILSVIIVILSITTYTYKWRSERDLFTGCYTKDWAITRRNSKLARMMKRTDKKGVPFGLAIIDFDDFKSINDKKGHPYGDQVILSIVNLINKVLKKKGVLIRYGGDELMVLISNTYAQEFSNICNDFRFAVKGNTEHTVSVGGAMFIKGDEINVEKLIGLADKNLYAAKEKGKDWSVVT